jgi:hypothetical protein
MRAALAGVILGQPGMTRASRLARAHPSSERICPTRFPDAHKEIAIFLSYTSAVGRNSLTWTEKYPLNISPRRHGW